MTEIRALRRGFEPSLCRVESNMRNGALELTEQFASLAQPTEHIGSSHLPRLGSEGALLPGHAQELIVRLAASHGRQLRRFLLARLRNPADVPDIVQEVYLRMLRVPDSESIRSPEAYLFTIAAHVVQQHTLRQSASAPALELTNVLDAPQATPGADPALELDAHQCLEQLQAELDQLPPKARAAFLLHRRDGLLPKEIAVRLGISYPMVKKYLVKALMQLRKRLEAH